MTKEAVPGVDDARGWNERLAWAYGLIAPDPTERTVALARLDRARAGAQAATARYNEVWYPAAWQLPFSARKRAAAQEANTEAASRSLPEALWARPLPSDISTWPGLPFAVLYLEWEARYPQEWTEHAKLWGVKQSLIRQLATASGDPQLRAKLVDLVDLVVQRAYRCKDREYVRVARAVDGPDLRDRLAWSRNSQNPWARLHAGYVLWLLDHPEIPNTRRVWRTWLADLRTPGD
ncbi:hypothetical protein [Streptomyces fulvoviolaceus]|uniref:hypothetical protein n=1 Tax=Streptomyces fulvoviolaceus TaxID=285535 RepID=UPI0004C5749D|nr:hypothetical protein [Streptomyces fulvoviolaceus]MCT9080394.1 hypothetical protein [Streptomyces fulvoviolaceus]